MKRKFKIIQHNQKKEVALQVPSTITVFETMADLKLFLQELIQTVSNMEKTESNISLNQEPVNQKDASVIIAEWESLLRNDSKKDGSSER